MIRILLIFAFTAAAQPLTVGISGGVPISAYSRNSGTGCINVQQTECGPNDFYMKPYAIGPQAGVRIRWGLSLHAGALYERFHIDQAQGLTVGRGSGSVDFGHKYGVSANAWLFPLMLRYRRGRGRVAPFVEAGATLRHLGVFTGSGTQVDFYLQPHPSSFRVDSGRALDVADTVGAGVAVRAGFIELEPEIRFLHWTSPYYQPAQNQAMLMLGIVFPARSP